MVVCISVFATKNRILVLDICFLALKCLEDDEDAANRSGSSDLLSPPAHNSFSHAPNFKDFPVPQFPMPPVIDIVCSLCTNFLMMDRC